MAWLTLLNKIHLHDKVLRVNKTDAKDSPTVDKKTKQKTKKNRPNALYTFILSSFNKYVLSDYSDD
jgi:hypothetical protein